MQPENREASLGPIIGVIVILAIIIIGGLYFWSTRPRAAAPADSAQTSTTSDADIQSIQSQSSSDDTGSIQADLDATNVDSVDSGLQQQ